MSERQEKEVAAAGAAGVDVNFVAPVAAIPPALERGPSLLGGGISKGVYIKGMEMPKDGEMLCINIYPDGKVCINLDLDCKQIATAVPVPPHGRLIDADALKEYCKEAIADSQSDFIRAKDFKLALAVTNAFCKDIDDAPTIIEGDRNDSEKSKTV